MDAIKSDLTDGPIGERSAEHAPALKSPRLLGHSAASAGATAIVFAGLLMLSPLDAQRLFDALARLFHIPIASAAATPPKPPLPKALDITLVPKPHAPKPAKPEASKPTAPAAKPTHAESSTPPAKTPLGPPAVKPTTTPPPLFSKTPPAHPAAREEHTAAGDAPKADGPSAPATSPRVAAKAAAAAAPKSNGAPEPMATSGPKTKIDGIVVATRGEAAPMSETSGAIAGAGASATRGLAVPALNLSLTAEVIAGLLQTSTAVIVATPSAGTVRYILGNDGRFTKATNSQFAALSPRAFPMQEGTLATAWSRALERQDTQHTFVFALRFSDRAAAMIVNEQFGALKKRGIDFAKALAAGHTVVTDGVIDADTLNFHIVGVKEIP